MKIKSLQISNVLSFAHFDNIEDAPKITFDDGLNILIGQNGAGKSTALEVINFIFKRIIFIQFLRNQDNYIRRGTAAAHEIKSIIYKNNVHQNANTVGFRLDPHWEYQGRNQAIRLVISLDEIDERNIQLINDHLPQIQLIGVAYYSEAIPSPQSGITGKDIVFNIDLHKNNNTFSCNIDRGNTGSGVEYLTNYNLFKELIELHNFENPTKLIPSLLESFALISSYRNYHSFSEGISLSGQSADQQIQAIRQTEYMRSNNVAEQAEPAVFNIVRLLVAGIHYESFGVTTLAENADREANKHATLKKINAKLSLVGLKAQVSLLDKKTWSYSFSFIDINRNRKLTDINSLSAGQKAIIHLVFEAYARGELKGGVVIIDEPEIHLHYQFQNEYLRVIEEINQEQQCQYILVTHSESLINSKTISKVRRFALSERGYSIVKSPIINEDQKSLVKILDNTRSIYAFFAKKVVLVEGDSDRYLLRAIFQELYPQHNQEIAILDIGGKGNLQRWKQFFSAFGLVVYYIGDFDNVMTLEFSGGPIVPNGQAESIKDALRQKKLDTPPASKMVELSKAFTALTADPDHLTKLKASLWKPVIDRYNNLAKVTNAEVVQEIKATNTNIDQTIEEKYAEKIYILKRGAIEEYIGGAHADLNDVSAFCETKLSQWLSTEPAREIREIASAIANDAV
jgi:predicted ATP-dependent endonuclease of OLD family